MTTTDKLDDAALEYIAQGGSIYTMAHVKRMATELVERRRASQAAPAQPTEAMLNAARDWSDAKYGKPIGNDAAIGCWNAMLAAAPAPPDGLREEATALLDMRDADFDAARSAAKISHNGSVAFLNAVIRAASPAQEGGE